MAIRRIVKIGGEVLRKKAKEVTNFDDRLGALLSDMAETMKSVDGVGIAAPQVGILRRAVVIDCGEENNGLVELVNPVIVEMEGEQIEPEGCLSIPGRRGTVKRPTHVVVEANDRLGNAIRLEGDGVFAVAVCHELDHLEGILFLDNMIEEVKKEDKSKDK